MNHSGSCLCGCVAFTIEGAFDAFYFCHCKRCRKDTGTAHAANLFSLAAKLKWLSGENKITTHNFLSDGHIMSFCSVCGSALPNLQRNGDMLVVPAGCLDSEVHVKPSGHIFCAHRADWDKQLEDVIAFDELPPQQA